MGGEAELTGCVEVWKCDFGVKGGVGLRETGRLYDTMVVDSVRCLCPFFCFFSSAVTLRNRAGTVRMSRSGSAFFFYIQPFQIDRYICPLYI